MNNTQYLSDSEDDDIIFPSAHLNNNGLATRHLVPRRRGYLSNFAVDTIFATAIYSANWPEIFGLIIDIQSNLRSFGLTANFNAGAYLNNPNHLSTDLLWLAECCHQELGLQHLDTDILIIEELFTTQAYLFQAYLNTYRYLTEIVRISDNTQILVFYYITWNGIDQLFVAQIDICTDITSISRIRSTSESVCRP